MKRAGLCTELGCQQSKMARQPFCLRHDKIHRKREERKHQRMEFFQTPDAGKCGQWMRACCSRLGHLTNHPPLHPLSHSGPPRHVLPTPCTWPPTP